MSNKMNEKLEANDLMTWDYTNTADSEETYDRQLAAHTQQVVEALVKRGEYLRSRLDQ